MMKKYFMGHGEKVKKYFPLCIIALVSISIIWNAVRLIGIVWNTGEQCYLVNERNTTAVLVTAETFRTAFIPVGEHMLSLDIQVSVGESPEGVVAWSVEDSSGNPLIPRREQKVSEVLTEDRARLSLQLSGESMERGESYSLVTEFSDGRDIAVLESEKGLSLIQYFSFQHGVLFTVLIIVCSFAGLIMLGLLYKKGLQVRWYVVFSLFIGFLTVFLIPPVSKDDEFRHFVRVYTLARGENTIQLTQVTPEDFGVLSNSADGLDYIVTVPEEVNEIRLLDFYVNYNDNSYHAERNQSLCLDKLVTLLESEPSKEEVRVSCVATATRGILNYWPQVVPVWLGMLLGIRPIMLYYLSRIGQMLVAVLFGALALKLAPKYKDMFWLLSFIPNVISLRSSCNSDGLMIAEMMLLVAVVLWIRERGNDIFSKKALWADAVYLALTYQITVMKVPYFLFCIAMLFALKKENFGKIRRLWKRWWKILIPGASVIVVIVGSWGVFGGGKEIFLSQLYTFVPEWHVSYMLEHPGYIVKLFCKEFYAQIKVLYHALNGANIVPYAIVIVVSLLLCKREMSYWKRLFFAASFGVLVFVIILVGYTLTPPDYGTIWGISFRYLLPFLPLGAIALPWGTDRTQNAIRLIYPMFIVAVTIITCASWLVGMNRM